MGPALVESARLPRPPRSAEPCHPRRGHRTIQPRYRTHASGGAAAQALPCASPRLCGVNATMTRRLAAAAVILAVPALSSCHTSFGAQTDQVYTPGVGVNARDGMVDVLHAVVVTDGSGNRVIAGLANKDQSEADELTSVTNADPDQDLLVEIGEGDTEIPAAGFLQLADAAFVGILGEAVKPGAFVRLTFTFANAESQTLNVPVVTNTAEFAGIGLSGEPGGDNPVSGEETDDEGAGADDDTVTENTEDGATDEGTE